MIVAQRLRGTAARMCREAGGVRCLPATIRNYEEEDSEEGLEGTEEENNDELSKERKGKERIRHTHSSSDDEVSKVTASKKENREERTMDLKIKKIGTKRKTATGTGDVRAITLHKQISSSFLWPSSVCKFAHSLRAVPGNQRLMQPDRCARNRIIYSDVQSLHLRFRENTLLAPINTLMPEQEPWCCVEVREVPHGHPLHFLQEAGCVHRGVFATCNIPAGRCICEYVGELVSRYIPHKYFSIRDLFTESRFSFAGSRK